MTMRRYEIGIGNQIYRLELDRSVRPESAEQNSSDLPNETQWVVRLDGREFPVDCLRVSADYLSLLINGESFELRANRSGESLTLFLNGNSYECTVRDPRSLRGRNRAAIREGGEQKLKASMPGKVVRVLAQPGEQIQAGQGIIVIEAMKMQNEVRSPKEGTLKSILVQLGANVNAGDVLAIIE
jgi:biotin carboxyl carrier protein